MVAICTLILAAPAVVCFVIVVVVVIVCYRRSSRWPLSHVVCSKWPSSLSFFLLFYEEREKKKKKTRMRSWSAIFVVVYLFFVACLLLLMLRFAVALPGSNKAEWRTCSWQVIRISQWAGDRFFSRADLERHAFQCKNNFSPDAHCDRIIFFSIIPRLVAFDPTRRNCVITGQVFTPCMLITFFTFLFLR